MITQFKFITVLLVFSILWSCQSQKENNTKIEKKDLISALYEDIEFEMPEVEEPAIPNYTVNIKDFGAVGDGLTKNTQAIAEAIADVTNHGGGKIVIPRGIWLTGPIVLESNINIYTEKGALVIFSNDFDEYPLIETSFEGLKTYRCLSPIYGNGLENVAFTGEGVFDGSGDSWRFVKKEKVAPSVWERIVNGGGVLSEDGMIWFPTEKSKKGYESSINFNVPPFSTQQEFETVKDFLRPVMVSLVKCNKVLLDGPTFQNSPAWNLHPLMCTNVIIRNLTVRNPWYAQNGDGIDLESCKNVLIYNNSFDVGDDAICFKSGKDKDGRERGMPTENVIVKDNVVYHGHGGFVIGSEMSGGVRNVHVSNCTFIGTDVGLRFKSTRGRGGVVENIYISNIDMINIPTEAIRFNMFYQGNSPILEHDENASDEARDEKLVPVSEETPVFRNIFLRDITATGCGTAALFQGLPEMNLKNVKLENAVFEAKKGISMIDTDGVTFRNVKVIAANGPSFTLYNSKNIKTEGLTYPDNAPKPIVKLLGGLTKNITFDSKDFKEASTQIYQEQLLENKAYTMEK